MKRFVALALSTMFVLLIACSAQAGEFNKSALEKSTLYKFNKFDKSWKIVGLYDKEYSDAAVQIIIFLSDSYIEKGWGPDLRVKYYDKESDYNNTVNSIMFLVDDTLYSFSNFEKSGDVSIIFGGTVMQSFLNSLKGAKEVALQIKHTEKSGGTYTSTIDPVELPALMDFVELAQLFETANVWDPEVTPDLALNDVFYGASME